MSIAKSQSQESILGDQTSDISISNIFLQRYLAEKISLQKMGGSLERISSILAKSTIDLHPHQVHAALFAFNSPLSRGAILADEVGLGKTIEAGIILSQLWAEGKRRIIIICPASLRMQWQDELQTKFGLPSEIWDGPSFNKKVSNGEAIPFTYDGIFITSYNFIYKHLGLIEKQPWNVVVIDEAHRLRNVFRGKDSSKTSYEIREIIKDKPKVLLTATPLQNSLEELWGLASFIDDKLLGTFYSFKSRYIDPIKEGEELGKQKLLELRKLVRGDEGNNLYSLSGILNRTLRKQVLEYVSFKKRTSLTFDFTPTPEELELYNKVSEYLKRNDIAAITATQKNLMILIYRKLLASSSFAITGTLKKLILNLEAELKLRESEELLASDESELNDTNDLLDDEVEELELEAAEEKLTNDRKKRINKEKFTNEDLNREKEELESYYNIAIKIRENSKGIALINSLQSLFKIAKDKKYPEKAVVFTESRRTQDYLTKLLKQSGISYTLFNGSNNSQEARNAFEIWKKEFPESAIKGSVSANIKQSLVHEFKNDTKVFLTTEAGAEGLNLQFSNIIINYDLPWNPQRVEQRIGRCHRYGQKYEVIVANFLNTENYADKRLLQLLNEKLNLFEGLFGASDEILGIIESGIDFEKKILEIYQNCKTPEEYEIAFNELQENLKDKISEKTLKYRELLMESTDQSVVELFNNTDQGIKEAINALDKDLLYLCQLSYLENMKSLDKLKAFKINNYSIPIAFRMLKEDEKGKIAQASKSHPIIKKALDSCLILETNPIPSLNFNLSNHSHKIFQLQNEIGKEGYIFLWKLIISGIENEEILLPLTFIRHNNSNKLLEIGVANELLYLPCTVNSNKFSKSPVSETELLKEWTSWKDSALKRYKLRNERLFDHETDRINRFYDSYALKTEDKIEKLLQEKKELTKKHENSSDMDQRIKLKKELQNIQVRIDKLELEKADFKKEAAQKREQELNSLWSRLELKTEDKLIAITHFNIV